MKIRTIIPGIGLALATFTMVALLGLAGKDAGFLSAQIEIPSSAPLCSSPSTTGGFTLDNCVPDGVAGKDTVKRLDVAGIRDLANRYIVVILLFLGSLSVAIIVFKATDIALYASNDAKRKEAIKAIQWVLFGLLGATLSYMIITALIRGFYGLANG